MADVEKVIDNLYRLKSHLRVMCVGMHDDYYTNSVQTVDEAIQTIEELQSNQCHLNSPCEYQNDDIQNVKIQELREDCNRYHEWGFHEGYEQGRADAFKEVEESLKGLESISELDSFMVNKKELKYGIRYALADIKERLIELKGEQNE